MTLNGKPPDFLRGWVLSVESIRVSGCYLTQEVRGSGNDTSRITRLPHHGPGTGMHCRALPLSSVGFEMGHH